MYYVLLFHGNNGHENAPQCYVTRTLPVLLLLSDLHNKAESDAQVIQRQIKLAVHVGVSRLPQSTRKNGVMVEFKDLMNHC
jgi:hypothetical protein